MEQQPEEEDNHTHPERKRKMIQEQKIITPPYKNNTLSSHPSSLDKRRKIDPATTTTLESASSYGNHKNGAEKTSWIVRIRKWCVRWEVPRKVLHTSIGFITLHQYMKGSAHPAKITHGLAKTLLVIVSADILRFRSKKFARVYEALLGFLMRPAEKTHWNGVIFYLLGVITSLATLPLDISVLSILILSWVDTAASVVGRAYGTERAGLPSPPFARRKSLAGFVGALVVGTATAAGFWGVWAGRGALPEREALSWIPLRVLRDYPSLQTPPPPPRYRDPSPGLLITPLLLHHPRFLQLLDALKLPNPNSSLSLAPLSLACGLVAALAESFDLFGWDDNLVLPILSGWGIWGLMKSFS
ncbi:hypothetical protein PCANC_13510 [Puccinia coronata f. sp. avenae]|uniref:Phosphatidate cytidylyltransferase n=1 Tax=Puccinia coronata f. sp. avenae TaxID=200324 RepID=A0A2N5TT97_9BASI|nr:hypothetical protein PCASD_21535 [Puccinia coronata f. sp. avenae]PLW44946.1 hypothetical protein PCANC_13510 [Puccinia coronata f. sp. avenae]